MLRADMLAFAALEAVGSLAVSVAGDDVAVIIARVPVVERLVRIFRREQVGDTDAFGALALFDAVAACCAGDQIEIFENGADAIDSFALGL